MLTPEERKDRILSEIKVSQVVNVKDKNTSTCPCCGKSNKFSVQANRGKCWSAYCELNDSKDVIGLYGWKHNLNFWDSIKAIETEFGLPVGNSNPSERSQLLEKCLSIYKDYLWAHEGKQALDYLRERGFLDSTIRDYRLGYAPNFNCLRSKGISASDLAKEGLFEDNKEYYSKRIILPIRDRLGHLVHFTGRYALPITDDSIPRYKDTKKANNKGTKDFLVFESEISNYLKNSDTLYVGEGYPDTLSLRQLGLPAVGSLGLEKLTGHYSKLKDFKNIVFMFDNDTYDADNLKYKREYKSWVRVVPQLIDLQIVLPNINFYTCLVPANTKTKQKFYKPTKDINEWISVGELTGDEVKSYITLKKKEFVTSLVDKWGSNRSQHFTLLKLITATNKHYLKAELAKYIDPKLSIIDYACELIAA